MSEFNVADLRTVWSARNPVSQLRPITTVPSFIFWTNHFSQSIEHYVTEAYRDIWSDIQTNGWSRKILLLFMEQSEELIPRRTRDLAERIQVDGVPFTFISLDPLSDFCQKLESQLESKPNHRPFKDVLAMILIAGYQG